MRIAIGAVGRLKAGPERDLVERYLSRARALGRSLGLRDIEVREVAEAKGTGAAERRRREADALLDIAAGLGAATRLVCLDEQGEAQPSEAFAAKLAGDLESGVALTLFLIGGPDGLDPDLLARADRRLSLGAMTWPHQLARVLLSEQIYRALTLMARHPYHRA